MWELYCMSHRLGKACTLMKQGFFYVGPGNSGVFKTLLVTIDAMLSNGPPRLLAVAGKCRSLGKG
jgi:hypothetical protein